MSKDGYESVLNAKVGPGPGQACHELIRATAIEMAGELYDIMMKNNQQYGEWKRMHPEMNATQLEIRFIELKWPELIEDARSTLASMLSMPTAQPLKDKIFDVLIKDAPLKAARQAHNAAKASNQDRILH